MTRKPILAALAVAAATTSGAAFASTGDVAAPAASIRYGDLDLASPVGRRTLDRRLDGAVSLVCGTPDAGSRFAVATCRSAAERDARDQLRKVGAASF